MIFRAIWPIYDDQPSHVTYAQLVREATEELPALLVRHHARATGRGVFTIAASVDIPGSGRVTESVLVWEGPVVAAEPRLYQQEVRRAG